MSKITKTNGYDELLLSLISRLDEFESAAGSEGDAYFVDDKFVVKTFNDLTYNPDVFNRYCEEIKNFADMGLAVPKIYSWCALPYKNSEKYKCYLLEEKVEGRNVFQSDVENIFYRCENFCFRDEFEDAIYMRNNPQREELFAEIVRQYILEFIETNESLLNMSESNLEKFFESDYYMSLNSRYSANDVLADNIIFDRQKLTHIDNAFLGFKKYKESEDFSKIMALRDAFIVFEYNNKIRNLSETAGEFADNYGKLQNQNREVCFEAMRRFVRKANQMYSPIVKTAWDYSACNFSAASAVGEDLAEEVCQEIQKDF